jgi:hypothetical protein
MALDNTKASPLMIGPALLFAAASGGGYGALSSVLPLIKIKAFIIIGIVVVVFALFSLTGRNFLVSLIVGLLGGMIAVGTLWFGWYWVEFGQDAAIKFITSGPYGIYKNLLILSQTYVYSMEGSTSDNGSTMTQVIWGGETALFFLTPVAGSLFARTRALRVPKP